MWDQPASTMTRLGGGGRESLNIMQKEALDKGRRISHFICAVTAFSCVEKEVYSNYVRSS